MDAWIEIPDVVPVPLPFQSHPMWMRGLKFVSKTIIFDNAPSHPMWMRGLKYDNNYLIESDFLVASYVDAWIEISCRSYGIHE